LIRFMSKYSIQPKFGYILILCYFEEEIVLPVHQNYQLRIFFTGI